MMDSASRPGIIVLACAAALAVVIPIGCGGGGGGSGGGAVSYDRVALEDMVFPDPSDQSSWHDKALPDNASLIQRIQFIFSGPVAPADVGPDSLQVRGDDNVPVSGEYVVRGNVVSFYPDLPTKPIVDLGGGVWDVGGAGLQPDSFYNVNVPVGTKDALSKLTRISSILWTRHDYQRVQSSGSYVGRNFAAGARSGLFSVRLKTTAKRKRFLTGYSKSAPGLVSVFPEDSAENVSPFLFNDPAGLFKRPEPFRVIFNRPLDPALDNVSDETFKLVDIEDANGTMMNIELGAEIELVSNRHNEAIVEVRPAGILPFGDLLGVTYPLALRNIAGGSQELPGEEFATIFRVAPEPPPGSPDYFQEDFHTTDWEETRIEELGTGVIPARWDYKDSDYLQAAFSFSGSGELGRFVPVAPEGATHEVVLDTNSQTFPLFDGSTPEAQPGTVVQGGVFNFSDIVIPRGVTVKGQGANPLVMTATGTVMIAGVIDVSGSRGVDDQSYDSAINPTPGGPGGPGGGRGGVGNPTRWYGDQVLINQVPPRHAEQGWGPGNSEQIGGGGGEGTAYPDPNWPGNCKTTYCSNKDGNGCGKSGCNSNAEFSRGAGGGGGSMLSVGDPGRPGKGNKVSLETIDLVTGFPKFADNPNGDRSLGGVSGQAVFSDGDPLNDFIGALGEAKDLIGGQGGGGGGNRHDSLMCSQYVFNVFPGFPGVLSDSKGGGGGGAGGAFGLKALGAVQIVGEAKFLATGGSGGGGEQIGCSTWGAGAGAGAGGAIVIQSASSITMVEDSGKSPSFDVSGGNGNYGQTDCPNNAGSCGGRKKSNFGSGGDGGDGIIQIQVPAGQSPDLGGAKFKPSSSLIPPERTPSELTPFSVAQTRWINVGEVIRRSGPPVWSFTGTDPATGRVVTDSDGFIVDSGGNDFKVDLLPVTDPDTGLILERGVDDFIPPGAYVQIEFQAADAAAPGSKDVDSGSVVPGPGLWSSDIGIADGHQFFRYRVLFNIADADQGYQLGPERRQPVMRFITLPFDF